LKKEAKTFASGAARGECKIRDTVGGGKKSFLVLFLKKNTLPMTLK
jgi:hypothetical protein